MDTPPKTASVSGASISMIANCRCTTVAALEIGPAFPDGAPATAMITPTATNDSQKPADNGARGSNSNTATSASAKVWPALA